MQAGFQQYAEGRILAEAEGAIGWLTFNQPERLNAVRRDMWDAIPAAVAALMADPAVRCIVLRGAGERASVTVVALPAVVLPAHRAGAPPPPPPLPFELIIGVVGYDPHTCTRYDETSPALSCMRVLTAAPCLSPQVRRDEPGTLGDDPRRVSGTPLVRASTGRRVLTQRVRGAGEGRGLYAAAVGDTTGHAATF